MPQVVKLYLSRILEFTYSIGLVLQRWRIDHATSNLYGSCIQLNPELLGEWIIGNTGHANDGVDSIFSLDGIGAHTLERGYMLG